MIPQDFERYDIIGIYNMLLHYRADNFKEAVIAWFQHCAEVQAKVQHDREVKEQHDREVRQARQAELAAERQAELAKRQAKREAERQAKAQRVPIISTINDYLDDSIERDRKERERRRDKAVEDIAKELKRRR